MEMTTRVQIAADPDTVFALASAVEDWPRILPHYRSVRVLRRNGQHRLVEMAAHRDGFPVRWMAIQELRPAERRILLHHVRGITRGMDVAWTLTPDDGGVRVELWHRFTPRWPLVPDALVRFVIGDFFVENIASKTLRRIKQLAEADRTGRLNHSDPVRVPADPVT